MELTCYFHGRRSENKIALTFDDGPNPFFTERVLGLLQKYNIKATFFLIGKWATLYPNLVKKISSEGHLIGNHTYSHCRGDFKKADRVLEKITDKPLYFIRPPYSDLELCRDLSQKYLERKKIIKFDVDSQDWNYLSASRIIERVKKRVKGGSIIDLHDGSEKKKELRDRPAQMLKALPLLIRTLRGRYELVRVDELTLVSQTEIF